MAIGLTMPYAVLAILRSKLTPSVFDRAIGLAERSSPADAVERGWLDLVVEPEQVVPTAQALAASFSGLDRAAHHGSKLRARADLLTELRRGIEAEYSA